VAKITPVAFLIMREIPNLELVIKDITGLYESIGMELVYRKP